MTLVDVIIVLILLFFAVAGLRRGAVWEILITIGLVAGFGLTWLLRGELLDLTMHLSQPGWQRRWVATVVFLAFFLIIYLGFAGIGRALHKQITSPAGKWIDRAIGLLAGLIKGVVLVALLVLAVEWMDTGSRMREYVYDSKLVRWGKQAAFHLIHWEPASKRTMV